MSFKNIVEIPEDWQPTRTVTNNYTPDEARSICQEYDIDSAISFCEWIMQNGKHAQSFYDGNRHNYIYNLACLLNEYGVNMIDASNYINATYPHFRENPSNALESGYKDKHKFGTREFKPFEQKEKRAKSTNTKKESTADQGHKSESDNLKTILATREKLKALKGTDIKFSQPLLMQNDNAVIFPNTISVIQGQAGVHKSRVAENICSAFLKRVACTQEHLGFKRNNLYNSHTVVYVDTERNLSDQLPFALQSIQVRAGYDKEDHPENFEYISLLQVKRSERFKALDEYLNFIRQSTTNPLFVVLDVSTDCIEDFNKTDKSMELIDLMNMAINEHQVTFLCLIHENPKTDKARGHFGTELMNKSSTVMQVAFEKDANQNDTDIIRVKYLKCRSTKRHNPFYIKYCQEAKGLVLADAGDVSSVVNSRKHKASNEDMTEYIEMYLGDGTILPRVEFLDKLCKDFKASQRTIETRISEIVSQEIELFNNDGEPCKLTKETKDKVVYYKLTKHESF